MVSITLKNIPEHVYQALKERAASHRRSLNSEAIDCLEKALLGKPLDTARFLERVRALRNATPGRLDESLIRSAKNTDRP